MGLASFSQMVATIQRRGACDTTTPFLKWLGGKRLLVHTQIKPVYDRVKPVGKIVEPFCGGLSVSLGLQPERALLNDSNPYLVNLYQVVADGHTVAQPYCNTERRYYQARDEFNALIKNANWQKSKAGRLKVASLFYYLNRHCFNGLIRFNSKGEFNAAYGKYRSPWYEPLDAYKEQLGGWTFTTGDFEQLTGRVGPSDFLYADPPYDTTFTKYTKDSFDWEDQLRLANWLAAMPCTVVASNAATPRICALYRKLGFDVKTIDVARRISCDGNRDDALEMVAVKEVG